MFHKTVTPQSRQRGLIHFIYLVSRTFPWWGPEGSVGFLGFCATAVYDGRVSS